MNNIDITPFLYVKINIINIYLSIKINYCY